MVPFKFLWLAILVITGCSNSVIKKGFDFSHIQKIGVANIEDIDHHLGIGSSVKQVVIHELMKNDINVIDDYSKNEVDAVLTCNIIEFNDCETIQIPIEKVDHGGTTITVEKRKSKKKDPKNKKSKRSKELVVKEKTVYDKGMIKKYEEVIYLEARIGLSLKLVDVKSKSVIWSSQYSYNSLSRTNAIQNCVKGGLKGLGKRIGGNGTH